MKIEKMQQLSSLVLVINPQVVLEISFISVYNPVFATVKWEHMSLSTRQYPMTFSIMLNSSIKSTYSF